MMLFVENSCGNIYISKYSRTVLVPEREVRIHRTFFTLNFEKINQSLFFLVRCDK